MTDIVEVLESLARKRPIFHLEADFQHALSWEMHLCGPESSVRPEYPLQQIEDRIYLDIWQTEGDSARALELKYKTRNLRVDRDNEVFDLLEQSAQDHGRYDFIKDARRLEQVVLPLDDAVRYAIILTNDRLYWNKPSKDNTVDADFRLHEGRTLSGVLAWSPDAAKKTTEGREEPIHLRGSYRLHWRDYSEVGSGTYSKFRYLLVEVRKQK